MQNMFRLPWCADQIAPKLQTGRLDSMRASPVMEIPMLHKLKRKRTESPEPLPQVRPQPIKKQRGEDDAPSAVIRLPIKSEREFAGLEAPSGNFTAHALPNEQKSQVTMTHASAAQDAVHHTENDTPKLIPALVQSETPRSSNEDGAMPDTQAPTPQDRVGGLDSLQQVIENEFNMQILMKHNELRLIEQELAKCQIALEQLRRCEIRPFLGVERPALTISSGTGPAVAPPHGYTRPSHAAPQGVTDGPYTNHYRQWLLRDSHFDPAPVYTAPMVASPLHVDARSTRHASTGRKSVPKVYALPSSSVEGPRAQPVYPATARKYKLAVVKRSTDGQLVKLVCNHCHRSDFSNSQGFLNHCRIAHKVEYKSHDHAAIDCGQVLDEHELASVPPEAHAAPAPKPSASRSASTTTTPFKKHTFVHPMNMAGAFASNVSSPTSAVAPRAKAKPVSGNIPMPTNSAPFKPASQAPRLSAHFAKYNLGGDLQEAIANAKQKVDLGVDDESWPDTSDSASPLTSASAGVRTVLGVPRAGSLAPPGGTARPPSRKGYRQPASRPRPSPLAPGSANAGFTIKQEKSDSSEIPESPHARSLNLSPNTVDGNPGLVSDHEDDDHGSASEDDVPQTTIAHSLGVRRRDCSDSMELDVSVDDDMHEHGVIIRRNSMLGAEERGLRTAGSPSRKV